MPKEIEIKIERPYQEPDIPIVHKVIFALFVVSLLVCMLVGSWQERQRILSFKAKHENCPHIHIKR